MKMFFKDCGCMEGKRWSITILWHTDLFLGSDQETNNETIFAAREWLSKHVPAATDMMQQ
jgi:hypothetical protein